MSTSRKAREFDKQSTRRKRPYSRSPIRVTSHSNQAEFKVPKLNKYNQQRNSTGSYSQSDFPANNSGRFGSNLHSTNNFYNDYNTTSNLSDRNSSSTRDKHYGESNRGSNTSRTFSETRRSSPRRSTSGKNSGSMFFYFIIFKKI